MDINTRIATRLRDLRDARGYSLDTLAERSGVSRSNISLIERGQSSPTAVVLDKLAIGLGVAPCTAMVFVWSQLVKGDANYTLVQVSVNDIVMVFAFAPLAAFLLGVTNVTVPWQTLVLSTILYVVLPLAAGMVTRHLLQQKSAHAVADFVARLKPWSVVGLIATVVLLFGFQAGTIVNKPLVIVLIAIPLILQTYGIFFITWAGARWLKLPHNVAGPACLIGTSNFFELAVAVAISLFGLNSGAALATVVGVLVEVPVMLSLVAIVNAWRPRG